MKNELCQFTYEGWLGDEGFAGAPLGVLTPFSDGVDFFTADGPRREATLFRLSGCAALPLICTGLGLRRRSTLLSFLRPPPSLQRPSLLPSRSP